jgi:hypothetical protein
MKKLFFAFLILPFFSNAQQQWKFTNIAPGVQKIKVNDEIVLPSTTGLQMMRASKTALASMTRQMCCPR